MAVIRTVATTVTLEIRNSKKLRFPVKILSKSSVTFCNSKKFSQSFLHWSNGLRLPSCDNREQKSAYDFLPLPFLDPIKPFLRSEWKVIIKGWVCSVISVYCLSTSVSRIGKFSRILSENGSTMLINDGLKIVILALVRSVFAYLQQAFLWEAALNSAYNMRVYVFDRVLQRDLSFFETKDSISSGDIAHRITSETADVSDTVYALLNTIVPNTLQLLAMTSQMLMASPILSLISAVVIPCSFLLIVYLGEKLRIISKNARFHMARISAYLNEILPSMFFVKASNGELQEASLFQRLALADLIEHLKKKKMKSLIPQFIHAIYAGSLLVFCVGSVFLSRGSFDGSRVITFITSLALIIEPIQSVGKAYNELKEGEPAVERLFNLTDFISENCEKADAIELQNVTGDIKFCGVTFKYANNVMPVLIGLDLHIKPGETVALVGPSGGGKTTLAKLLLRLYDPVCGCILVDGHDIQNVNTKSLRRHIALVSQDIILFSGTITENIGYKDVMGEINMEQVRHAARVANAVEFIEKLPEGYETNIGQKGSLLSGGQKQRLAIARAIYQNSPILILDEATSALDSKSEILVRQAVERLMANYTVIVVSHRLDTISMADRILFLDKGHLQEVDLSFLLSQDASNDSLLPKRIIT